MSNQSGTGGDPQVPQASPTEDAAPEITDHGPITDHDPVTEVIDVGALPPEPGGDAGSNSGDNPDPAGTSAPGEAGDRRYTAPGFDAGSTQIIDRVADPPTEFIPTPTEAIGADQPRTGPQQIPAARRSRPRWLPAAIVAAVLLLIAALVALVLWQRSAAKASREKMVRTTIETFDGAVRDGDLATLRSVTCGETQEAYVAYDQQAWSDTYAKVAAAKQYPVVASIDEVLLNGDHAEANVTSYMAYDPSTTATRSFDLQFTDGQWRVCHAS